MSEPVPRKIKLSAPGGILVVWSDGHESLYPAEFLRQNCPCAMCRENPPLVTRATDPFPILDKPPIQADRAAPMGNYAIQFFWNDHHSSGIYTYSFLRELCPCPACQGK
jgi:DUF971 family protein